MISRLVQFVVAVLIVGLIALFLDWAMGVLGVTGMAQNIVWVVFGLIVLLGVVGLFGYGPIKGPWNSES